MSKRKIVTEIQGLRTLAALMMAIYYIWFQRVLGGVDVFFVVAAFFMSLSLMKHDSLKPKHVIDYYMNTFRRVFPNTTVVVIFSLLGLIIISPEGIWKGEYQ
ncbi:MAG: acyltransferase [Saccharospirillaceae bacterium]|nr:hypothetical protein A3759_07095 [Thalassolituus sp. HI0120]MCH2041658.1 acyltransferase [Saccharospirillaceae bacterium]